MGRSKDTKRAPAVMPEFLPGMAEALEAAQEANALVVQHQAAEQRQQEDLQLAQAAQAVGGALMARLHKNFSHAAEVSMFLQMRELPLAVLRRIPIQKVPGASGLSGDASQKSIAKAPGTSGTFDTPSQEEQDQFAATAANLDDFCRRVFGRSYNTMQEEAQNFHTLGEQAYESANRLRLSKSALRVTRALPPEKLEAVRLAIDNGSTKAEVMSVIEDLAEKVQQAEAATAKVQAELQGELDASNRRFEVQAKRIHELTDERIRVEAFSREEAGAELHKRAAQAMQRAVFSIRHEMGAALQNLEQHDRERHVFVMTGMVGQLFREVAQLRGDFCLPEWTGDETPEWILWEKAQKETDQSSD